MNNSIFTVLFFFATILTYGQSTDYNEQVNINNLSSAYPGLSIFSHDGSNSISTSHPIVAFRTSRGTQGNLLPVAGNRALGSFIFSGYDGSSYYQAARLEVKTSSAFSTSSHEAKMNFRIGGINTGITRMSIDGNTGNVGIGTTNPSARLHVNSNADVGAGQNPAFLVGTRTGTHIAIDNNEIGAFNNNGFSSLFINGSNSSSNTLINNTGTGKVGIGTTNPDAKLTVNGDIHAKEVRVDLNIPADYVFEKYYTGNSSLKEEYIMPSLNQVEAYTKENNHLPGIPSAKEIQEEGLQLGEMTNLLLQKIEELTLYTIEQQKRIEALENNQVKN